MGIWHKYAAVAYLAVFMGVIGHASSEFVSVLSGIKGPELSVWRFLLGSSGLVVLALIFPASRNLLEPFKTDGTRLIWMSALGVTLGYLLFHWSLDYATVPQVATMVTMIPIFVGLVNLWLNKQSFTGAKITSGISAMIGVALLITDGYLAELAGAGQNLIGILMSLGCAAVMAGYTVMVRPIIARYGALRITALTMFMGAVGLWIVVGLFWRTWVNPVTLFDRPLAAVPDITRGSYLFFLKPVIAAFLAVVFLSHTLTAWQMLAILVICASVVVEATWARFRQAASA
jgi:drug/metabolite transporter (DMT)-like permease